MESGGGDVVSRPQRIKDAKDLFCVDAYNDLSLLEVMEAADKFLVNESSLDQEDQQSNTFGDYFLDQASCTYPFQLETRDRDLKLIEQIGYKSEDDLTGVENVTLKRIKLERRVQSQETQFSKSHDQASAVKSSDFEPIPFTSTSALVLDVPLYHQYLSDTQTAWNAPAATFDNVENEDDCSVDTWFEDKNEIKASKPPAETQESQQRRFHPHQSSQWAVMYGDLCDYRERYGNCLVPHNFQENLSLAHWVKRQRYQYKLMISGKESTMSKERAEMLEKLGFVWDTQGASWYERLKELKEFKLAKGHCNVPSNFRQNVRLATWVKCQRRQYKRMKEGKSNNITKERIEELEKIGFEWCLLAPK